MLQFFRKHQRFLFLFTTIMIVISFTFFGTFSAMMQSGGSQEKPVMELVDGRKLRQSELNALVRMIAGDFLIRGQSNQNLMPNLLNGDFLQKNLFETKIALILAEKYFDVLSPELIEVQDKIHRYQPYVHPEAPFISAAQVWKKFAPDIAYKIDLLKQGKKPSPMTVAHLIDLYGDQQRLSPELVRRMLAYEQASYPSIKKDPYLMQVDLNLFGFSTMDQWFGKKFLEMLGSFVLNSASIAEKKGYKVSAKEARADLWNNVHSGLERFTQNAPTNQEVQEVYQIQLRAAGVDETTAISMWSKVMAFRKMLHERGESVFLDPLFEKQFRSYAQETAQIELYRLPASLRSLDFAGLLKLQIYLEEVADKQFKGKAQAINLPATFASVEEIEKRCPELVQRQCTVEVKHVAIDSIYDRISLKQTWDWQTQDVNWNLLKNEYTFLAEQQDATVSERFATLDGLKKEERWKIDQFSREAIAKAHPEWISEALATATPEIKKLKVRSQGPIAFLTGIENGEKLMQLFESGHETLKCFTEDQIHYYSFNVIEKPSSKEVLLFADALSDGTLARLLEKRLNEHYPDVRKKEPNVYQLSNGSWKNLNEVSDLVGERVFFEQLKAIADSVPGDNTKKKDRQFYATNRFTAYLTAIRNAIAQGADASKWVVSADAPAQSALAEQWKLEKSSMDIYRAQAKSSGMESIFSLQPGEWSTVEHSPMHASIFYKVLGHAVHEEVSPSEMLQKQHALAVDAQRFLAYELLTECERKDVSFFAKERNL